MCHTNDSLFDRNKSNVHKPGGIERLLENVISFEVG